MGMKYRDANRKKIARERIEVLFNRAAEFFPEDPEHAGRCVELARRIAMRQRVRIPRALRRRYCRRCHAYLVPGVNMRVRVHNGRVVVTCMHCGHQMRYPVVRRNRR
jgi:ribonuclease P protein subunit RPR2